MAKIRINRKSGLTYIPKNIREEGYVDDVEFRPNAITLTLIKPGATDEQIKRSLRHLLRDIELREDYESEKPSGISPDSSTEG